MYANIWCLSVILHLMSYNFYPIFPRFCHLLHREIAPPKSWEVALKPPRPSVLPTMRPRSCMRWKLPKRVWSNSVRSYGNNWIRRAAEVRGVFYFLKPRSTLFSFIFSSILMYVLGMTLESNQIHIIFGVGSIRNGVFSCFPSESRWIFIASHGALFDEIHGLLKHLWITLRSFDRRIGHFHEDCILLHGAANEPIFFVNFSKSLR